MNENQAAAFLMSQCTNALIKAMAMTAENEQRKVLEKSMAYTDDDLFQLIDEHGIGHNDALDTLAISNA